MHMHFVSFSPAIVLLTHLKGCLRTDFSRLHILKTLNASAESFYLALVLSDRHNSP